MMDEFYSVYTRMKLNENARKIMVMVFERREVEVVDFDTPFRAVVLNLYL